MESHPQRKFLLFYLVKRITIFLFSLTLLTCLFYVIGNIQGFLDSTQRMLLDLTRFFGLAALVSAFYGFAINAVLVFRERNARYLLSGLQYLLVALVDAGIAVFVAFISSWLHS
jgi:hypothetical protein